ERAPTSRESSAPCGSDLGRERLRARARSQKSRSVRTLWERPWSRMPSRASALPQVAGRPRPVGVTLVAKVPAARPSGPARTTAPSACGRSPSGGARRRVRRRPCLPRVAPRRSGQLAVAVLVLLAAAAGAGIVAADLGAVAHDRRLRPLLVVGLRGFLVGAVTARVRMLEL